MIPYFAYQRKRFFDFCLEKFYFSHTFRQESGLLPQKGTESVEMRTTDMADELFSGAGGDRPGGPRKAPRAVRHAGSAQRQRAGRAGRRRHRGVRPGAARPFAAQRPCAGAGGGQPPHHRRCPWPAHGAAHPCHYGRGRCPAGAGPAPGGSRCARGGGSHRAFASTAGGGAGGAAAPGCSGLRGQSLLRRRAAARCSFRTRGFTRRRPTTPAT